ncbi:MAG TPA: uroporphyrinogen decarboxylase family protein [bacterium]|nr:uroporphyrinogen decarboxylase family protein [bacterium]
MKNWEKKETFLKIIQRKGKGIIPARVSIIATIWDSDPEFFENLKKEYPDVSLNVSRNLEREKENFKKDQWGCIWHFPGNYLDGQVIEHPLSSWDLFKNFTPPNPAEHRDWILTKKEIEEVKKEGGFSSVGVEHGFFYLRLTYLRGFNNLMIDIGSKEPKLKELIKILTEYWKDVVKRLVELKPDMISFGDDLGHQNTLPINPQTWRELIKPSYKEIFSICREKGIEVYLHSDGYIVDIIPDLIDVGVTILNPQDLVNGLDYLEKIAKGKVTIDLDIDRQKITVFGKPKNIENHIKNCVEKLGSKNGGLLLLYGAYPGTPKENIAAVIKSMQKYHNFWV